MINYFVYNGVNSLNMGVRIMSKNVFSSPKFDLKFESIPGRSGDLITSNGRFPNITISYTCYLPAKSIGELADKITALKSWLYNEPDTYHVLSDSYDVKFQRQAVFNNKLDIADEINKIGTFTITFSCKPLKYSLEGLRKTTRTAAKVTLTNPYTFAAKPYIKIHCNGNGTLGIQSANSNALWNFKDIDEYIECDSEMMNFYKGTVLKNSSVEGDGFPTFFGGNNNITISGGITKLEIIPRWVSL